MKKYSMFTITLIVGVFSMFSCQDDWLEVKRDKKQVVPKNLNELQALLDNTDVMTIKGVYLGENSADDCYLMADRWLTRGTTQKNAYIWAADIYEGEMVHDWEFSYERIFYANTVLEGLDKIGPGQERDQVQGRALFYRAWNHYQLAQLFCKTYVPETASKDLGIPLKKSSNINQSIFRSSVQETYDFILSDLLDALDLLPEEATIKTRPDKLAAHALLSRIYLLMADYPEALEHAQAVIGSHDELLDYNTIDPDNSFPLLENKEVIFQSMISRISPIGSYSYLFCDPELYTSYETNDLRKSAFFMNNDGSGFKGSYSSTSIYFFDGLATDELYLTSAECYVRLGEINKALGLLNTLLLDRYAAGTFSPLAAENAEDALRLVLKERRKELLFRGIRWGDLKRLNLDPRFAKTLTRDIDGTLYTLEPGSNRYILPIPDKVIALSHVEQNKR